MKRARQPEANTAARGRGGEPVRPGSGAMFDRIAARYDLLNRVLSLGMDQGWRRAAVRSLGLAPRERVLDVATGTADMAILAARLVPGIRVEGVDPSLRMLDLGRRKADAAGLAASIGLREGDAQRLPFPADSFDGAMIAFGIRNVPDRAAGLREMARVVRPGRRLAVLELTEPRGGPLALPARIWVRHVIPRLGSWLVGGDEYAYLRDSMQAFPPPSEFAALMERSGVIDVRVRSLGLGACHLFVGAAAGA